MDLRTSDRGLWELSERLESGARDVEEILEAYSRIEEEGEEKEPDRALLHFLLAARLARIAYQEGHEEARPWVERAVRKENRLALFVLALRVLSDPFSFLTDAARVERLKIAALRDDPELARWGGTFLGIGFDGAAEAIADVLLEREARGTLPPELERSLWIDLERAAALEEAARKEAEGREEIAAGEARGTRQVRWILAPSGEAALRAALEARFATEDRRKARGGRTVAFFEGDLDFLPAIWPSGLGPAPRGDVRIVEYAGREEVVATLYECWGLRVPVTALEYGGRLQVRVARPSAARTGSEARQDPARS